MNCLNCDVETSNPKFCSRSCSASLNNALMPKRKLNNRCFSCEGFIRSNVKYCSECYQVFIKNRKVKFCDKHQIDRIIKNGKTYKCIECNKEAVVSYRQRAKKRLVENFGGKCKICGYKKSTRALHFHHVDPSTKSFGIGTGNTRKWELVLEEVKKCILVCSNCHGEIHDGLINLTGMPGSAPGPQD